MIAAPPIAAPPIVDPALAEMRARRDALRSVVLMAESARTAFPSPRWGEHGPRTVLEEATRDLECAADSFGEAIWRLDQAIALAAGLPLDVVEVLQGWEVCGEYVDAWLTPDGLWAGDKCGCQDDRCIGYHHDESDECGCLEPCIEAFIEDRYRAALKAAQ